VRTELENPKERVVICIFAFIGGSMGAVVGEKFQEESITIKKTTSFIMISKSGGARMMEAAYSLMQLAKHL
jgi:acetyl-CoA carboxylase carboxyl transferase subunit beta